MAASGSTQYTYDAMQQRVQKSGGSNPGEFVYFGGHPIAVLNPQTGAWTDLIYAGDNLIAEAGANQQNFTYRLLDHLGSAAATTDASGNVTGTNDYAPYGPLLATSTSDPYLYTGLYQDTEYGGYHAWHRNESAEQIRWLSPDPYNGSYDLMDPQTLNRYAYVNNNPLGFTDPTGLAGAGAATGIGGNLCLGYKFNGINPCSPVTSAIALGFSDNPLYQSYVASSLAFVTTFACGFASSSDAKSAFCGQSGLTGLFSKNHPDLAMGINDAVAATQLVDSILLTNAVHAASALSLAGGGSSISTYSYLWSCATGAISNPVCDVAIALIVYSVVNDIISVIEDFLSGKSKFTGSLLPRPSDLGGLGTAPIGIPNQNLSVPSLLGHAPRSVVPSPGWNIR